MARPPNPSLKASNHLEVADETTLGGFDTDGTLPEAMSGRLVGAYGGVVHSVDLRAGRVLSYQSRRIRAADGSSSPTSDIVVFGGSILAYGAGSLAHALSADLDTARPVDLAGQSRPLSACPKHDPITGDLHLLAVAPDGAQAHVVVSSGALTRRIRPILDAPSEVADVAITRDHVLFVCDGFVGVTCRDSRARITWIATGVRAPVPVHAHDRADTIVVHAVTPSLEQWTLDIGAGTVHCEVLDPAPRRFPQTADRPVDAELRFLWTIGDGTVDRHDLTAASRVEHSVEPRQPGDLAYVADPARPDDADGGWLVAFAHHAVLDETDLVVLDAADITRGPIVTVRIPRRIPRKLHTTWIPSTDQRTPTEGDRP